MGRIGVVQSEKARRQECTLPDCYTDAAFGLVDYLRRGDMVLMPLLRRQLECKALATTSEEIARQAGKIRAKWESMAGAQAAAERSRR